MARNEPFVEKEDEVKKAFDEMLIAKKLLHFKASSDLYFAALNMFELGWHAHERMWRIRYGDDGK